ncbi:MAG: metal ABC transporter permease [Actinobacteria bacterium]|nr:metal ABC transporter permease [Actinomycetota bacterium]
MGWITDPFGEPIVLRGAVELVLLGVLSGGLGCWIVLSGVSSTAESLSHGMLPGLVGAALLGIPLLLGGAVGLVVAAVAIALVQRSPLTPDVATSVVITGLLGAGVLLGLSPSAPAGLGSLLFGDLLGVSDLDLALAAALGVVVTLLLFLLHPTLLLTGFDRLNATALGRSPARLDLVLAVLLALATLVAVQALGTLLVVAMLVGPAATARLVSRRVAPMMLLAVAIAVVASVAGLAASYHANLAAGACVVLALAAAFCMTLAGRGIAHVVLARSAA